VLDKVKIIESSDSSRTHCLSLLERAPIFTESQSDIVRLPPNFVQILNLDPMARFLREPYINTSTSNGSLLLAFVFSC
jgi:hypothetical protein